MTDKHIEKFRPLDTWTAAYMRGVTFAMHHEIQGFNHDAKVIGRAFTVNGPDIYVDALEAIPEGSIYVQAEGSRDAAIWSGRLAVMYGKPRGLVGAVIDGGIFSRKATEEAEIPSWGRFVSPRYGFNRLRGEMQVPVVCGGSTVIPGDIIIADADGVVVIPQTSQDDIYEHLDGFLGGIGLFIKIADKLALEGGVISRHEALGDMFAHKEANPFDYWRYYEPWAAKWRDKYGNE